MIKFIAIIAFMLQLAPFAISEELNLKYGANHVDINADNVKDLITKVRWYNLNAHSFDKYLIAIRLGDGYDPHKIYEVPLGNSYDYSITTSEGAGCSVESENGLSYITYYKFSKDENGWLNLTKFKRPLGGGYGDKQPVTVTKYKLTDIVAENDMILPGDAPFYLKKIDESTTREKYCNVEVLSR